MKSFINTISRIFLGIVIVLVSLRLTTNHTSNINTLNNKINSFKTKFSIKSIGLLNNYTNEIFTGIVLIGVYTGLLVVINSRLSKIFGTLYFTLGIFTLFSKISASNYNDLLSKAFLKFDFDYNVLSLLSILGGVLSL